MTKRIEVVKSQFYKINNYKGLAMANNQTADLELTAEELREFNHYVGLKQALERKGVALESLPEDYTDNKLPSHVLWLRKDAKIVFDYQKATFFYGR